MIDFNKYFIVGTNSDALRDTMNGLVVGELIRCRDCVWFDEKVPCCRLHSRAVFKKEKQFCSWAEPKEEKR